MKDTDWVFGLCRGNERLKDENGIKAHPTQKAVETYSASFANSEQQRRFDF